MTADDRRYTLREAADVTGKSIDTLRLWAKNGQLPGAGKDPADPTRAWYIPATALIAAGLMSAEQLADGEPEAVIARRRAERDRDADHDELLTLRVEKVMLHREKPAAGDQLVHARKLNVGLAASLGKAGCLMGQPVVPLPDGRYTASLPLAVGGWPADTVDVLLGPYVPVVVVGGVLAPEAVHGHTLTPVEQLTGA